MEAREEKRGERRRDKASLVLDGAYSQDYQTLLCSGYTDLDIMLSSNI